MATLTAETPITEEMIDVAEAIGACAWALDWLRAEPRQWRDVPADWRRWLAGSAALAVLPELAAALARDENLWVRAALAGNPAIAEFPALALVLSADPEPYVRWWLADTSTDSSALPAVVAVLSADEVPWVRQALAGNAVLQGLRARRGLNGSGREALRGGNVAQCDIGRGGQLLMAQFPEHTDKET